MRSDPSMIEKLMPPIARADDSAVAGHGSWPFGSDFRDGTEPSVYRIKRVHRGGRCTAIPED